MIDIEKIAKEIYKEFKPISIFLYGSAAKGDSKKDKDYEIGVIQKKKGDISRRNLKTFVKQKEVLAFPFVLEEIKNYSIDTPFQKEIYVYELIRIGKTLAGQRIIEKIELPNIKTIHLIEGLGFELGQALAAIFASRQKDRFNASKEYSKSCLFGTKMYAIFCLKKIPLTFDEIFQLSRELDLGEYRDLVDDAYKVRNGKSINEDYLYKNIGYLNKFIKEKIIVDYKANGDKILI